MQVGEAMQLGQKRLPIKFKISFVYQHRALGRDLGCRFQNVINVLRSNRRPRGIVGVPDKSQSRLAGDLRDVDREAEALA